MEGTCCEETGCLVRDFLPFNCSLCEKCYCLEHRSRFHHSCVIVNPSRARLQIQNMKEESLKDLFDNVSKRFDISADFNDFGTEKTHLNIKTAVTSIDPTTQRVNDKILKLSDSNASTLKQKFINKKTREILIAKNAIGNESIEASDRFYLTVKFNTTEKFAFFSKSIELGVLLHQVGTQYPQLAFGTLTKPTDMSLGLITDDTADWRLWNLSASLQDLLLPFETISVIPLRTSLTVENQATLQEKLSTVLSQTVSTPTATPSAAPEPAEITTPAIFNVGDSALYSNSSGEFEAVRVIGRHHDDFPNIYYTITVLSSNRERQTDSSRLKPITSVSPTAEAPTPTAATDTDVLSTDNFSIQAVYAGSTMSVEGVNKNQTIAQLKILIQRQFKCVPPMKLIYRGRILKDTDLVGQSIVRNCKVTVIASMS